MGKRRTDMPHKDRYAGDDSDDEDVIEELQPNEPLTEEVKTSINARKKLVAKRRVLDSERDTSAAANNASPFAGLFAAKPATVANSTEESGKPSVFSGFKGFGSFTSSSTLVAPVVSTEKSSILLDTSNKTANNNSSTASNQFSFLTNKTTQSTITQVPLTTTTTIPTITTTTTPVSFFSQLGAKPASNGTHASSVATELAKIASTVSVEPESSSAPETQTSKNVNDLELRFIKGLNELYESCYGSTGRRNYKIPDDVATASMANSENSSDDDPESKYAYMLAELNKHCSKWISKHVEESPLVILTPVFVDYFNYLILLEKQFFPATFQSSKPLLNGHKENNKNLAAAAANETTPTASFKFGAFSANKEETASQSTKPNLFSNLTTTIASSNASATLETTLSAVTSTSSFPTLSATVNNSPPVFKFGSDAAKNNSTTTTASFTPFLATTTAITAPTTTSETTTTTPSLSFFGKKSDENSEKKENTGTAPASFFSNLVKKEKLAAATSTTTPATSVATNPAPFFNFQSNMAPSNNSETTTAPPTTSASKPSIFGGLNAGGDIKSIFGSNPFCGGAIGGGATPGGGLFGAAMSGDSATFRAGGDVGGGGEGEDDEAYEPPKPESSDVKEEGSVLTKRCKLFYFNEKEKKFTDRGIGNLFIKPINNGEATQLIVRADNKLANILLNVKLSKALPISKVGSKDVSYLCLPNPPIPQVESNVPCKFLFKVKTEEDATELFDKLNEYKK